MSKEYIPLKPWRQTWLTPEFLHSSPKAELCVIRDKQWAQLEHPKGGPMGCVQNRTGFTASAVEFVDGKWCWVIDKETQPKVPTERELLEAVAAVVGGKLSEGVGQKRTAETWDDGWEWYGPLGVSLPSGIVIHPFTNNNDAFWLMSHCQLDIKHTNGKVHAGVPGDFWCTEAWFPNGSIEASTRLAIVRAVAELNKREHNGNK